MAAAAISLDGRIKQRLGPHDRSWISTEDKQLFAELVELADTVVLGRKTFLTMRPSFRKGQRWIVMTRNKEMRSGQSDEVEFSAKSATEIVSDAQVRGSKLVLVVGGSDIYAHFLQTSLLTDFYVTIEPVMLGVGKPFLRASLDKHVRLKLLDCQILNASGSLFVRYKLSYLN